MRIAMWSGPRNISTAMMYSFANRPDFAAWDEPFYAAYLRKNGLDHPLRNKILKQHESDPIKVAALCAGPIPTEKPHFYMKHMPLHMLDDFPLDWAENCINVHLVRHPARVVSSYAAKRENPNFSDIGYAQQTEIFKRFPGPVLDSDDIRAEPERILRQLCDLVGLEFDWRMLCWPSGEKSYDGVWASHWYGAVHASTGFAGREGPVPRLAGALADLVEEALPHYIALREQRIR